MSLVLKAVYRIANKSEVCFIQGKQIGNDLTKGFVFNDFEKQKAFGISPDEFKSGTLDEVVENLTFQSHHKTEFESTSKDDYDFGFTIVQNEIKHAKISKTVLSRIIVLEKKIDALKLFRDLIQNYPNSHIFLTETPEGNLWIGATPETLIENDGDNIKTMSLAGTKKDLETNWGDKEYNEQKIVTNSIVSELFQLGIDPVIGDLETVKAGVVYHLRNLITFKASLSLYQIADVLHPTPAISGSPKAQALSTIKISENHKREYYCGFGGPVNLNNETHLFVNLRCAEISSNQVALFVGGGLTKDSVLEKEWEECDRKAESLLRFIK